MKTKNPASLKRPAYGLKFGTGQGMKGAQIAEKTAAKTGKAVSKTAGTAAKAGAVAASAGIAAGVSMAVEAAKKGAKKIQEIAEKNVKPPGNSSAGKKLGCFGVALIACFIPFMILFFALFGGGGYGRGTNIGLSEEVIAYLPLIEEACTKYGIPDYVELVAAIIMQESGGKSDAVNGDVMQCAEAMGHPAGTPVDPAESIDYGVKVFAGCIGQAAPYSPQDMDGISLALQGYNFGGGYISWALGKYGGYSKENAIEFSNMKAAELGWSSYGDIYYVENVLRYYHPGGYGEAGETGLIGDGLIAYPMPGYTWTTYAGHSGIDISGGDIEGKPIIAAAGGKVSYVRNGWQLPDGMEGMNAYGNVVFIDHEGTPYQTRYGHMTYAIVASGEYVQQGQIIGYVGNTGNSSGPHLHFEININGKSRAADGRAWAEHAFPQYRRDE